jgi:hypothetical protein
MITKTQAIKNFLADFAKPDLASLYNAGMEVQVNVAQDQGEPVSGEAFNGRMWRGYTDGEAIWKSFRIPFHAATTPAYNDSPIKFNLEEHAEAIGFTGWHWASKTSRYVAYDFDAIIGHNNGLSADDLKAVTETAMAIPWVTVRRSTSGNGIHLYVFLPDVPTENHTEHAALSRAILGKMSAIAGFDFNSKVDICGGNTWVWARKSKGTNGLELIKQGEILKDIPENWKDHVPVITGKRKKSLPSQVKDQSLFEQLTSQSPRVTLDPEHRKLLDYLDDKKATWWYDADNGLLVCHTYDLKQAHTDLNLRGLFDTISTGKDRPDHNCFMSPIKQPEGSWLVRRFTPGIAEAKTWFQDSGGWTCAYFNKEPTLSVAARSNDGIEDEKGNYHFNEAETAAAAASALGAHLNLPNWAGNRKSVIKQHRDGKRIVVAIEKGSNDNPNQLPGWRDDKGYWKKIFNARLTEDGISSNSDYDNTVRHLTTVSGTDAGWVFNANDRWLSEPLHHLKIALKALGLNDTEINKTLGKCVIDSWTLVNKPFEPEYPGDREWNKDAVQLKYAPQQQEPFQHPYWDKLLSHCGSGLDADVKRDGWCSANGVLTGADYLRLWVASLFQNPIKHLPYLFLYSPEQQTGKTTLHEALKLLITSNGYMDVKAALINPSGFNEEMKNAIICAVDECDLRQNKYAYNRIKDWITGEDILIHPKGKTPYMVKNMAHFIHTGNDPNECPVFSSDSRIVVIRVPPLDPINMIPKDTLFRSLDKEAPDFLATLLKIEIPPCNDRLNIPVIETEEKSISAKSNRNSLEVFLDECCHYTPGFSIRYNDISREFLDWLDVNEVHEWSKIKMGRSLPAEYPKGRLPSDGSQFHVGNISLTEREEQLKWKYVLRGDTLIREDI